MKTSQYLLSLLIALLLVTSSIYAQPIPSQNHQISLADAKKYIQNYRSDPIPDSSIKGGAFNREIFDNILGQPGCVAVRYYYAKTDPGVPTIVVIGVDATGRDIENGIIGELSQPCPPYCDPNSTLLK